MISIYEKHGDVRIYSGIVVVLVMVVLGMLGVPVPTWLTGICGIALVPYIIINAWIVVHQEEKYL